MEFNKNDSDEPVSEAIFHPSKAAVTKSTVRLRAWLCRVVGWDGLLPASVALLALAVRPLKNEGLIQFAAVAVPICALLVRLKVGMWHVASNNCPRSVRRFQYCLFYVGVLMLLYLDMIVISVGDLRVDSPNDLLACGLFFSIYLLLMAIAMFPGWTVSGILEPGEPVMVAPTKLDSARPSGD